MRIYLIGFGSASLIFVVLGCWFYVSSANDKYKPNEKNSKVIYRDKEVIKKVLVRDPLPNKFVDYKSIDTVRLWNGIDSNSLMNVIQGGIASEERTDRKSYTFDFNVNVRVPFPVKDSQGIFSINPNLSKIVPELGDMIKTGKVSGFYHKLYDLKAKRLQQFLTRLNAIPDRHNFYDCETILELVNPRTKRKILFIQSDMDVVSDGSDGDRMPEYDQYIAESTNYQPFTSYGWKKQSVRPNPLLKRWEKKVDEEVKKIEQGKLSSSRVKVSKKNIETLKREIADMKSRSFLIARADPFIVIPSWMRMYANQNEFSPSVGDYVAIIFEDRILPAIIGDTGPTWKLGEASLRVAKELNSNATSYKRPVSDLKVSYLIFPGSADSPSAPDLDKWFDKVQLLLGEVGGLGNGFKLYRWPDYFIKKKQQKN
ncbi:MAG: glycoside hydrolase family 75 protein [Verrucomicrobiota bacterium]|nr:glycoside hydrolase family 75 protein [Verrucomicrobiota bacterium]MEE2966828.1 glycoside hydrolase family 75 protein [Verrucomicrobiota bacterium]